MRSGSHAFTRLGMLLVGALLWMSSAVGSAEGQETASFAPIRDRISELGKKYRPEEILVVFDIDNTLLAMRQDLGSAQWFDWQNSLLKTEPSSPDLTASSFPGLLRVQAMLFEVSGMRPTQPDLAAIIQDIQKQKVVTVLLTSRGPDVRDATERALEDNQLCFLGTALLPREGYPGTYQPYQLNALEKRGLTADEAKLLGVKPPSPVSYGQGIYMTAGQDKGIMLRVLLAKTGSTPRAIVFVDDQSNNIESMKRAFAVRSVELITFRFSGEDRAVKRFASRHGKRQARRDWIRLRRTIQQVFPQAPTAVP